MSGQLKVGDHVTWSSEAGHVSGTIVNDQGRRAKAMTFPATIFEFQDHLRARRRAEPTCGSSAGHAGFDARDVSIGRATSSSTDGSSSP